MGGKTLPTQREDVFQICFVLGLDLEQSDRMLGLLTDQGIHYRNVGEMIYAYCLRFGLPYSYACQLRQQFEKKPETDGHPYPVTRVIQQEFRSVQAEEDLFSFIAWHKDKLGTHHNTAYTYVSCLPGREEELEAGRQAFFEKAKLFCNCVSRVESLVMDFFVRNGTCYYVRRREKEQKTEESN